VNALLPLLSAAALASLCPAQSAAERIDRYLDRKAEGTRAETEALLEALRAEGHAQPAALEALLRAPRASYPDANELLGKTTVHDVSCYHVDHTAKYRLFVPEGYRSDRASPLVVVAHGGNSSMSAARAARTASGYLRAYAPAMARELGAIVVAPDTTRGWGHIGNSLALTTIADLKRRLNIDPDRIYVTGQSMGGHMAFRAALTIGDRFGAVSPQSGGYDFVAKGSIGNLSNVPGYVTWGKREPYGINKDSRTNAAWAKEHGLDWVFVEKPGGHEIYGDELPKVAAFFAAHPRDLYRKRIYTRLGGAMKFVKTWGIKGWPEHTVHHETRPLRWNQQHWLELTPRPEHKGPLLALAENVGDNRFEIVTSDVRELHVHLHPKMIDFEQPVTIAVNGEVRFEGRVTPDPVHLLEHARAFDDRGKVFWARVRVTVETDREVAF